MFLKRYAGLDTLLPYELLVIYLPPPPPILNVNTSSIPTELLILVNNCCTTLDLVASDTPPATPIEGGGADEGTRVLSPLARTNKG